MRILVFLDTPRQVSYIDSVRRAAAHIERVSVKTSGPGVSSRHFGLESEISAVPIKKKHRGLLKWALPTLNRVRSEIRTLLKNAWSELRFTLNSAACKLYVFRILHFLYSAIRSHIRLILDIISVRLRAFVLATLSSRSEGVHPMLAALYRIAVAIILVAALIAHCFPILREWTRRRQYLRQAVSMLKRANPDVLVMMEDNAEGLTGIATQAARKIGVKFVILPDYIPNPREPASYYAQAKSHQVRTLLDYFVALARPEWVYSHNGKDLLRLPSASIIAGQLLGFNPPAPWVLNSGDTNAIALDSPAMERHYLQLGFAQAKLEVIGTAQDDLLYSQFLNRAFARAEFEARLDLSPNRPLVLCALPPNQYTSGDTTYFEYENYFDLLKAWLEQLAEISTRANVIVRPHPRIKPEDLQGVVPPNVQILWSPTEELIPLCDFYLASVSTTIRWALGLGIPVLNYDCYRYDYGDFSSARGIFECSDRASFSAALPHILDTLDQSTQAARADRLNWGRVDGRYSKRLASLIEKTAHSRSGFSSTHGRF